MNIETLIKQFQSEDELKAFCSAQFKQISQLTAKIKELEDQLKNKPAISTQTAAMVINNIALHPEEAKNIAEVQLKFLKDIAFTRELTLEEAKKVSIYHEILKIKEEQPKTVKANAKVLKETELLSLVSNESK